MTALDWVTIALYFGLLGGLTWWAVWRNRKHVELHALLIFLVSVAILIATRISLSTAER